MSDVIKLSPPNSSALGFRTLESITGEACGAPDPLAGKIIQEGSPRHKELLSQAETKKVAFAVDNKTLARPPKYPYAWRKGDKVYHSTRKMNYTVTKVLENGIEVQASATSKPIVVRKENLIPRD